MIIIKSEKYNRELRNIDSHIKAYLFGLFYSDGNVHSNSNSCSLTLQDGDSSLLKKLQKEFPFFGFYSTIINSENTQNIVTLRKSDKDLKKDLIFNGVFCRKSYENKDKISIKYIPKKFLNSFFLGYFDGDGSIFKLKYRNLYAFEVGSVCNNFIQELIQYLKEFNIKYSYRLKTTNSTQIFYTISIQNSSDLVKLREILYNNCSVFLDRKKEKFDLVIPKLNSKFISVKNSENRGFICPICNGANITLNGSRLQKIGMSYRYICTDCNKNFTTHNAPSCSDARSVVVQLDLTQEIKWVKDRVNALN